MEKETIYDGRIAVDNNSLKVIIEGRLNGDDTVRYYILTDKGEENEIMLNPLSERWEEAKIGETALSTICGEIIEGYFS